MRFSCRRRRLFFFFLHLSGSPFLRRLLPIRSLLLSLTSFPPRFFVFFNTMLICTCLAPRGETLELFKKYNKKKRQKIQKKKQHFSEHLQDLRGRSKKKKKEAK